MFVVVVVVVVVVILWEGGAAAISPPQKHNYAGAPRSQFSLTTTTLFPRILVQIKVAR